MREAIRHADCLKRTCLLNGGAGCDLLAAWIQDLSGNIFRRVTWGAPSGVCWRGRARAGTARRWRSSCSRCCRSRAISRAGTGAGPSRSTTCSRSRAWRCSERCGASIPARPGLPRFRPARHPRRPRELPPRRGRGLERARGLQQRAVIRRIAVGGTNRGEEDGPGTAPAPARSRWRPAPPHVLRAHRCDRQHGSTAGTARARLSSASSFPAAAVRSRMTLLDTADRALMRSCLQPASPHPGRTLFSHLTAICASARRVHPWTSHALGRRWLRRGPDRPAGSARGAGARRLALASQARLRPLSGSKRCSRLVSTQSRAS